MDQEIEKKIETWATSIGDKAFLSLNENLSHLIREVQTVADNEILLATIEAGVIGFASGIDTKETFFENVGSELSIGNIQKPVSDRIFDLLEKFIANNLSQTPISQKSEKEISDREVINQPVIDGAFTGLRKSLTGAQVVPPIEHEHAPLESGTSAAPTQEPKQKAFDPYRELPQ